MFRNIFLTGDGWTGLILRITVGVILFPHGAQKVLGWFGGPGFGGEMEYLTKEAGLATFTAFMVIMIEFFCSLMLVAGLATRIAALGVAGLFIGIIWHVHGSQGFFMNWFGRLPAGGEGYEYHLLVIGICLALLFTGGGRYSADGRLWPHNRVAAAR